MSLTLLAASGEITASQNLRLALGVVLMGTAVAWFAYHIFSMVYRPYRESAESWEFEEKRRIALRCGNRIYRWFEPLVDELKENSFLGWVGGVSLVENSLRFHGEALPWTPGEFLAMSTIRGFIYGVTAGFLVSCVSGLVFSVVIALFIGIGYLRYSVQQLSGESALRMARFKRRLPFAVDLMALMMEAGAGFRESLRTVVNESQDHPIGVEFATVLHALARGQSMRASLEEFKERLGDKDVDEMVFSIVKAEELGTPLSKIFLSQADQIRLKRSQWAEVAAGKAQTMITFPGLLIMFACLLIVTAPFVIDAIHNSPF